MLNKTGKVFLITFVLNLLWEFAHANLYLWYKSGEITNYILVRAAFWDAVILTGLFIIFYRLNLLPAKTWLVLPIGIVIAYIIEIYALNTYRWEYNQFMPIVPLLEVGLSPLVQLAITGYVAFKVDILSYSNGRKSK